ncbi:MULTISPECIES: helix-turn-helix transcriptional regulator [unclassified Clostridium]|uniref:helix-turn-helix transcriptional regulator n=1 Tax=unclassified Clostridium TaxID=2614128 RepID=UPI0025BE1F3F|nr:MULTISPECIES: YafY family protein [unclassified Clostridium]
MKIDRLLGIITVLLNNDKIKSKDLAEKFEVSIRTIYRDIEDLCKAGIPIVTYQGGNGGIGISEGYVINKNILTIEELDNIMIGLKSIESISHDSNVKLLLEKLMPKREDIISVSNNMFIDLSSFYKTSLSHKISILRKAIYDKSEVTFEYFSPKGISKRCIEPYFITFKWSAWYVFGYCKSRKDFRLFKINRMNSVKESDIKFTIRHIPTELTELDNYFTKDEKVITMLIDRSIEYEVVESYGVNSYEITEDNRIKFNLHYTNHDFAMKFIMGLGDKVEVLSPKSIIDQLKVSAGNILNKYK